MSRLRYAGLAGTVGSSGLTNSATAHTFTAPLACGNAASPSTVPTLAGADYFLLSILDTSGRLSEIVKVTAYNSSTGAATLVRGQEGTSGVTHASGDAVTQSQYPGETSWTAAIASPLNSALTGWTAGTGTWTAETDRFRLNSSATNSAMRLFYSTIVPQSSADVSVDIRIDTSTSTTSSRAGIIFAAPSTDTSGGLLVALAASGSTTQTTKIHTEIDAVANLVDFTLGSAINHGTWMTLRVVRFGLWIDVYLNGTLTWSESLSATSGPTALNNIDARRFALVGFAVDASFRNLTYNSSTLP